MRSRLPGGRGCLAIVLHVVLAASSIESAAETTPANEVQDLLQIPNADRRRLIRGEIVSYSVPENSEREIAVGLAMIVSASADQVGQYIGTAQLIAQDPAIMEFGLVPEELGDGIMVGPGFAASDRDEALSLFEASPGTRFNLSMAEIEALRTARGSTRAGSAAVASDTYRRLLSQRVQTYRQGGLAGIAPYARSGGAVMDPSVELKQAIADLERAGRSGSDLREALQRFPADQRSQITSQAYWVKRRVQHRLHLSLLHRMTATGPGGTLHLERYFFVGHSFNSMQILTGALRHADGIMVFSTTRVSTDEVLGIGNQFKRTVARGQVRDEMRPRLERLRSALQPRPGGTESP